MAGPWPLAPHHDHLQYIHHVHLMQWGQNQGVTFTSPFNSTVLSAYKIQTKCYTGIASMLRRFEQK